MIRTGTAGWSIPRQDASNFPPGDAGSHLQRYAQVMTCAEVNTSFYRSHRFETYQRWAGQTPAGFRFSVKLPRTITHESRLRRARAPLQRFLSEIAGLGSRLGVLLVQLPPSLAFEPRPVRNFFRLLHEETHRAAIVVEARHASWFTPAADRMLAAEHVARAAVDPALCAAASRPGGWLGEDGGHAVRYYRWHGSPRMYWSSYAPEWLAERAAEVTAFTDVPAETWCIFDNTAGGQALSNAMALQGLLAKP